MGVGPLNYTTIQGPFLAKSRPSFSPTSFAGVDIVGHGQNQRGPVILIQMLIRQLQAGDVVLAAVLALLASIAGAWLARLGGRRYENRLERYRRFAWQLAAVLGLEQAYEFTRGQIPHETDVALMNSYRLLDLEWSHGFFIESRVERFFLQFGPVMNAIDIFYIACHVTMTIGVLVWLYTRRPEHYPFIRNLLLVTTAIALVAFYLYPTAPPRLLSNYGFVDPTVLYHLVSQGGAQVTSYTYNPYAAMPSLHVGYAIVAAWGFFIGTRSRIVRVLAVTYPFAMAAAVIISGNHWVLDVVGAVVTVLAARLILYGLLQCRVLVRSRLPGLVRFEPLDRAV
jgi:hypothetical protein